MLSDIPVSLSIKVYITHVSSINLTDRFSIDQDFTLEVILRILSIVAAPYLVIGGDSVGQIHKVNSACDLMDEGASP